jgi:hypothetical protein
MKTKLIPFLIAAATMCAAHAQQPSASSAAPAPASANHNHSTASLTLDGGGGLTVTSGDDPQAAPGAENRLSRVEVELGAERPGSVPSVAHFGQRLQAVIRRGDAGIAPGSIILTSPTLQKDVDELSEDLTVLNFIFNRNIERTFGETGTEYRLGVPITMRDSRLVETSYLQDFGVLVKVHVPFPVISAGDAEKKVDTGAPSNSEWEKARRAVYGDGGAVGSSSGPATMAYDERLVAELKRQIFDALKNAANIRHLDANQTITVAVVGGPNAVSRGVFGGGNPDPALTRSTVLTIRVSKAQADAAAKNGKEADDLAKQAVIVAYFDPATAISRATANFGGMTYGSGGFGYGSNFAPAPAAVGR